MRVLRSAYVCVRRKWEYKVNLCVLLTDVKCAVKAINHKELCRVWKNPHTTQTTVEEVNFSHISWLFNFSFEYIFSFSKFSFPIYLLWQRTVVKTKSVKYMPFYLSFFQFLVGGVWSFYALLIRDYFLGVRLFSFSTSSLMLWFSIRN